MKKLIQRSLLSGYVISNEELYPGTGLLLMFDVHFPSMPLSSLIPWSLQHTAWQIEGETGSVGSVCSAFQKQCSLRRCAVCLKNDMLWKMKFCWNEPFLMQIVFDVFMLFILVMSLLFYPRPVLAFGYCRCLRVCVCACVCPSITSLSAQ